MEDNEPIMHSMVFTILCNVYVCIWWYHWYVNVGWMKRDVWQWSNGFQVRVWKPSQTARQINVRNKNPNRDETGCHGTRNRELFLMCTVLLQSWPVLVKIPASLWTQKLYFLYRKLSENKNGFFWCYCLQTKMDSSDVISHCLWW